MATTGPLRSGIVSRGSVSRRAGGFLAGVEPSRISGAPTLDRAVAGQSGPIPSRSRGFAPRVPAFEALEAGRVLEAIARSVAIGQFVGLA
jgi:hypothetical protein